MLSSHRNGYVREAAIAEIVRLDDPLALQALILRSSDWVAEVRFAACQRSRNSLAGELNVHVFPYPVVHGIP